MEAVLHDLSYGNVIFFAMATRESGLQLILLFAVAMPLGAQARFDVSSVKPRPDATVQEARFTRSSERLGVTAGTVGDVLDMMNEFQLFRVLGGPSWMRTDRFDIVGKADKPLSPADFKAAVMALLAERFQLKVHQETRDMPGFAILMPKTSDRVKSAGNDERYSLSMNGGDVIFIAAPMGALTNYLSQMLAAPVVDQTKLEGAYDFTLRTSQVERHPGEKWGDWVREALEDIGFRVESQKIPMDVTVVDRCERPNEN